MQLSRLDRLYDACGALAGLALMSIGILVLLQASARWFSLGAQGLSEWAGYMMAASSFLAFAHTLRRGGHIRVQLLLQAVPVRVRRLVELFSHGLATLITGYLAFYATKFVWISWTFEEISEGSDAMPLWIPRLSMALGSIVLFIAMAHSTLELALGRTPPTIAGEGEAYTE
jgi:TRAP-type C4-dicarboxylate transport system permease small subunit